MDSSRRGSKRDMNSTGSYYSPVKKFRGEQSNLKTSENNSDILTTEYFDRVDELNMMEINKISFLNPCRSSNNFFTIDKMFKTNNKIWKEEIAPRNSCDIKRELKKDSIKCEMKCYETIDLESSDEDDRDNKTIYNVDDELTMNVPMQEKCSISSSTDTTNLSLSSVDSNENRKKLKTYAENVRIFSDMLYFEHQNLDSDKTSEQHKCLYEESIDRVTTRLSSHSNNVDYGISEQINIKDQPREIVEIYCNNDSQEENKLNDNFPNFGTSAPNNSENAYQYLTSEGDLEKEVDYFLDRVSHKAKESDRCNDIEIIAQTKSNNIIYNKSLVQHNLKEACLVSSPNTSPNLSFDVGENINSKSYQISSKPSTRNFNSLEDCANNIFNKDTNLDDSIESIYKNGEIEGVNVSQCLKGWKIKYPWVNLNEKSFILTCKICSQSLKHYEYEVCVIKCSEDIFRVATNLLRHSATERHLLLHFVNDYTNLQSVFTLLKYCLENNISKEVLLYNINYIVKSSTGSAAVSILTINLLIKVISSVVNDYILHILKTNMEFGITFLIDPCKKILIARFVRSQERPKELFPEEIVVTDYANSPVTSFKEFLVKNDLCNFKKINFIRNSFCSKCLQCNNIQVSENTLPPRFPNLEVFQKYILSNEHIQRYFKFIFYLSLTINENYEFFKFINGILLVRELKWCNVKLFSFLSSNINDIVPILTNLSSNSHHAKLCIENIADLSPFLFHFIDLISDIIDHYYSGFINDEQIKKAIISKKNFVSEMMRNESKENSSYVTILKIIEIFINECLDKSYNAGRGNMKDFYLFSESNRLACVGTNFSTEFDRRILQKTYNIFSYISNINYNTFSSSLRSFGEYLCNSIEFRGKLLTMLEILKLFNDNPTLKEQHLTTYRFYIFLSTLPFYRSFSERSRLEVLILKTQLSFTFGDDLANDLFPIVQEGHRINHMSQFHQSLRDKIINLIP